MIWIIFIIACILTGIGCITEERDCYGRHDDSALKIGGTFLLVVSFITLCALYGVYHYNKYTIDSQIEVLEQQNEIVLSQIEPIVNNALTFESETYKELKLSPERIIAIGQMYPDLKNNTFLQTQMEIIIHNQQEITRFKLTKARLKAYKFFIWVKTE